MLAERLQLKTLIGLRRALAQALHEREGGAPPARLPEFGVASLSKLLQLVDRDYGEQPLFQGGGKLEGQPQVGMSRRKRQDLGSDVPFDIEAAEQVEADSPVGATPTGPPSQPAGNADNSGGPASA